VKAQGTGQIFHAEITVLFVLCLRWQGVVRLAIRSQERAFMAFESEGFSRKTAFIDIVTESIGCLGGGR